VHRIGRTGRAGRTGDAILFLTPRERRFLGGLERAVGRPIEPMEVPSNATINQNRLDRLRTRLTERLQTTSGDADQASGSAVNQEERALLTEILQRVASEQNCSGEQLALAALELSLGDKPLLLQGEENWNSVRPNGPGREGRREGGRDFGREGGREGGRDGRRSRDGGRELRGDRPSAPPENHMERFRIEVGWRDRIKPGNIVGAIANEAGINGKAIGRIQIFDTHSTVDLPKGMPDDVFQGLRALRVMNKPLQISRLKA
jgi:ATP-dependent RNA helicase DeaD